MNKSMTKDPPQRPSRSATSPPLSRLLFGKPTTTKSAKENTDDPFAVAHDSLSPAPQQAAGTSQLHTILEDDGVIAEKNTGKGIKGKKSASRDTPARNKHNAASKELRKRIKQENALNAAKAARYDMIRDIVLAATANQTVEIEQMKADMDEIREICDEDLDG